MTLMPCFGPQQAPAEGMLVGRILAGYGELELEMCHCIIVLEGQTDFPIRQIFGKRGAEERIKRSRRLLTIDYTKAGLQVELAEALADMEWCRKIRNQFAHCNWYWTSHDGLCFVDLEALAKKQAPIVKVTDNRRSLDVSLLQAQEIFFDYVKNCFSHLLSAYSAWDQTRSGVRRSIHIFPKPTKIARPPLHN